MAIYFYTSADPSAPVLSYAANTVINVLDACLVNGYGSKSPVGWTKEYVDVANYAAAYRGNIGNRMWLGVYDPIGYQMRFRGYLSMTAAGIAETAGTNPFPNLTQNANGQAITKTNNTVQTTYRAWILISDGKTVHVFIAHDANPTDMTGTYGGVSWGEFTSYVPNDIYNLTVCGANYSGGLS